MKILVAIPAYDRKITVETARALLNEQAAAALTGDEVSVRFVPGCSLITQARNHAVRDFILSDADKMVFVDSDVAWEPGSVIKLAKYEEDFVGGGYRYKAEEENYPVGFLPKPVFPKENGLIEVASLPGGFLALSRNVFDRLRAAHKNRGYRFQDLNFHAFFHCPPGDGEDGAFCRDWTDLGEKIWLDPNLTLTHVEGGKKYTGNIGEWLRKK